MNELESSKEEFDNWVDKWDQALQNNIFEKPKTLPSTSKETSSSSFFGLRQDTPPESIDPNDSAYWKAIGDVANGVEIERLDESSDYLPNPLHLGTEGEDQKLEPHQLGNTYTEEDLKKLEELKLKLHDIENKVAGMDEKNYQEQIKSLILKIEDLSNKMSRVEK